MTGRPVLLWAGLLATGMAVTGCASSPRERTMSRPSTPMASSNGAMTQTPAWNNQPASMASRQQTAAPTNWAKPADSMDTNSSIQQVSGSAMPAGAGQTSGAPMNPAAQTPSNLNTSQFNATPGNNTNFPSGAASNPYSGQNAPPNSVPTSVTNAQPLPSSTVTTRITSPPPPPPPQFEDGPPITRPPAPAPTTDMPPISAKPAADPGPTPPPPPAPVQK